MSPKETPFHKSDEILIEYFRKGELDKNLPGIPELKAF